MALPNTGTLSYNGRAFQSLYKSKVELKPVKDSAGRALVAREYTIDVEAHLTADAITVTGGNAGEASSTTDLALSDLRLALEQPGAPLIYTSKGFGNLVVNVKGKPVWDAAYGPWPEVLAWEPVGNDQGCRIRWRCTTLIPCEEYPSPKGIIEYCWEEEWDIDDDGYTTRTIDGHLTIEATRQGGPLVRSIPDNADVYLDQVVPDLPLGFRRRQNRKLSEDKRSITFHFQDEEMPAPLPPGISNAEVRHRVKWHLPTGDKNMMSASLSGTLTMPAGMPKAAVWDKIMLIVQSRFPLGGRPLPDNPLSMSIINEAIKKPNAAPRNFMYFLSDVELEDDVFGRSVSFSVSARIIGPTMRPDFLLAASGLWTSIAGTDFVQWKQSMFSQIGAGKAMAPRGMAGLSFKNQDDAIVDLCAKNQPPRVLQGNLPPRGQPTGRLANAPQGRQIDPRNTWIQYRLRLRLIENDRIARHMPLQQAVKVVPSEPLDDYAVSTDYPSSPGLVPPQPGELGGYITPPGQSLEQPQGQTPGATGGSPELIQRVSAPRYMIRLEGFAVRLGYPIDTPRLLTVAGIAVTQLRQNVTQEIVGNLGGMPLYAASWIIDYSLPQMAGDQELPMPLNPAVT